jgi:tetratricopeptide (TPR) repeat protein
VSTSTIDDPDPLLGRLVAQKYRLSRLLGQGGIGRVYLAEQTNLGRKVALKVLHGHLTRDAQIGRRFYREAKSASMLSHPNLLQIIDFGDDDGLLFIVMELITGRDLRQLMRAEWPLSPRRIVHIGAQILSALETSHAAGIVHRDLKPENVMLIDTRDEPDFVKLCDFGLAKVVTERDDHEGSALTEAGSLCGTPEYMSPEQARGESLDGRSDLYAVAVILYDMVVGEVPFRAETSMGVLMRQVHDAPDAPSQRMTGTAPALDAVIMKGLAKSPSDRFASAAAMRRALLQAVGMETPHGHVPASADVPAVPRRGPVASEHVPTAVGFLRRRGLPAATDARPWRRWRWAAGVVAVAVCAAIIVGWRLRDPRPGRVATAHAARRAVIVLGFRDLSNRADSAWLATALAEMLDSELGQGGRLRAVGGEEVARVKAELGLQRLEALGPEALGRIRRNVDADLVVVGSYATVDDAAYRRLRIDLRVLDTRSGDAVAQVAEAGREAELFEVVTRMGRKLRAQLGVAETSAKDEGQLRATLPANVEAARAYAEGLNSLRLQDATAARERLATAIALDGTHALSHVAQARAWSALGYDSRAQEEARRALDLAIGMPREQKLFVAAYNDKVMHDWPKAITAYKTLVDFFPDNVEYALGLAEVQWLGQRANDALDTITRLRSLPSPQRDDPRIDLAYCEALAALTNHQKLVEAAALTIQKARARGADSIVANAARLQSIAYMRLGQCDKAIAAAREAKVTFTRLEDRRGMALANAALIECDMGRGALADALRLSDESLRISDELGDRRGNAAALNRSANILSQLGRSTEATARWERAADIARDINDRGRLDIILGNLAGERADHGDLVGARRAYEEAIGRRRHLDDRSHLSFLLIEYAWLLGDMGELVPAFKTVEEGMAIARELGETHKVARGLELRATLLRASGDLTGARKTIAEAIRLHDSTGEVQEVLGAKMSLVDIELADEQFDAAESLTRSLMVSLGKTQGEGALLTAAHWHLARALVGKHLPAAARTEVAAASSAAPPQLIFSERERLALTQALVEAAEGHEPMARRRLGAVVADAQRARDPELELEARLALLQLGKRDRRKIAAQARALSADATHRGLLLLAKQAATLANGR